MISHVVSFVVITVYIQYQGMYVLYNVMYQVLFYSEVTMICTAEISKGFTLTTRPIDKPVKHSIPAINIGNLHTDHVVRSVLSPAQLATDGSSGKLFGTTTWVPVLVHP